MKNQYSKLVRITGFITLISFVLIFFVNVENAFVGIVIGSSLAIGILLFFLFLLLWAIKQTNINALERKAQAEEENTLNYEYDNIDSSEHEVDEYETNQLIDLEDLAEPGSIPFAAVVDVETTGLLIDDSAATRKKVKENPDWYPRIVQISWITLTRDYKPVKIEAHIIKQDAPIPDESIDIHGITDEMCETNGEDLRDVLLLFRKHVAPCDYLVCHNISFDKNIIKAECFKSELPDPFRGIGSYDTMKMGRSFMKRRRYRLTDIAKRMFGKNWFKENEDKWHSSTFDAHVTASVFSILHVADMKY